MIGHELGGRYEVIERVGGGGMALVYKAHDTLLNRKVAVKVLRQQYTNDEDFIRRFRREAQAAASLSHSNVVSIYDVGQDGDIHYIVMEYIEGKTLDDIIKAQAPLQIEEAVHIASQICDALDHAHQNQIIHRDIKPHNILIGKNGRIKVTDFGIARAAASSDITQTGAVLGSVHYFSPEHAKGVAQGAKSDLYSLGIVLYQMLTGKLPFIGESPISVALKHLQETMKDPRKVNPLIPQSVENIILKAVRKNPDERYVSAKQMLQDLDTCLLPDRRIEPKIHFSETEQPDKEQTLTMPAVRQKHFPEMQEDKMDERQDSIRWTGINDERPDRSLAWIKPLVWMVVIIGFLLAMWYGIMWLKKELEVPDVDVPKVVGMTLDNARLQLESVKLSVTDPVETEPSEIVAEGIVISQEKLGQTAKEDTSIGLVVSSGPETVFMDDYTGQQWKDVELALNAKYKEAKTIEVKEEVRNEPPGTVVGQTPAANEKFIPRTTDIIITVSLGPGTIPMPDLIGRKREPALAILEKAGFDKTRIKIVTEKAYAPKDYVFKQWPFRKDELVEPDAEITLYISDGLPDDAIEYSYSITVPPVNPGESTTVKFIITDASGDNKEWGAKEITAEMPFAIPLVLSPRANAVITVYRNDILYNSQTVTYNDAKNSRESEAPIEDEGTEEIFTQQDEGSD